MRRKLFYIVVLLIQAPFLWAQEVQLSTELDTTNIRIGEQLQFTITIEVDSAAQVFFPEGQTFAPLETVEAYKTDTTRKDNRLLLLKKYALTQFDSGTYLLPTQRIEVDGRGFFTDSVLIKVGDVAVDTTKQKMYDIKPLIEVDRNYARIGKFILFALLALLLIGGLIYWFYFRKKPLTQEEEEAQLLPYDRALLELKRLENSRYLIQDEFKKYYSELTQIVRAYLEEDVHVAALESTTTELIAKMELLKDSGRLNIKENTLEQFEKILHTADLVKFAKSKPSTSLAEEDRKAVELIVIKTKEGIPEPTEEELRETEAFLEEQTRLKKRKKIRWVIAAAITVLLATGITLVASYGPKNVWDAVAGHPGKVLLEGEWVTSDYGFPPITLETPSVLVRYEPELPDTLKDSLQSIQAFEFRSDETLFYVAAHSINLTNQAEPLFKESVDQALKMFEDEGARNIITKQEEFTSANGIRGARMYGSGMFQIPDSNKTVKGKYSIMLFGGPGFQQIVVLSWLDNDTYTSEVADKIMRSIVIKTET
jgi:flagellar basal body-associated protein FliL